jgi:ADP-ribose pyrophosphatase
MSVGIKPWEVVSREIVFQKYSRKIEKVIFRVQDGSEKDFYLKQEGPATAILAVTPDLQIILVKQFRPGPNEILHELPGGYINENETPEEAALRELQEETGYLGRVRHVAHAFDCAYSTMRRYCVVVEGCQRVSEQNLDNTEFAQVFLMPLSDFRNHLRSGKMTDIEIGYLGLDHLGLL